MTRTAPDGTAYDLTGPEGAPVLALIHGLGLCRQVWRGLLPDLADYRVLNYDLHGHGESAPLQKTATLTVYSDQLAGLLDHLGMARANVIGFSVGGMINRRFALDYPDRLAALVILNSPHDRGNAAQAQVEARAANAHNEGAMATMDEALKRWFTPAYLAIGDGVALVRGWRGQTDLESYAQAAWVLASGVPELVRPAPPITVPTLVMTCEDDSGSTPAMAHAIASEIAGAETVIVPGLRHLGLMEKPCAFAVPILDFLERRCP